jgi:hypothetical protein
MTVPLSFTCPLCRSTYILDMTRLSVRDKGSIHCQVCGAFIRSWEGAHTWSATLLKRGTPPAGGPSGLADVS